MRNLGKKGRSAGAVVVAGCIMSSFASTARAQSSVTLYGIMDAGIQYVSHASTKGGQFSETSGSESGSRFGFKGIEDLGGGLKAIFNLEGGISVANGTSQQSGRLFGRISYVGIQSDKYGAVTLGRQKVPIYDYSPAFDPMYYFTYSLTAEDAQFGGRADNSIKYAATFGPFSIDALFSTGYDSTITNGGQVPGEFRVGREYTVGGQYAQGPIGAMVVWDQKQGTSIATQGNRDQRLEAAVTYSYSRFKGYLGYRMLDSSLPASVEQPGRSLLYWSGLQYRVNAPLLLAAVAYWTDIQAAGQHPLALSVNADYALSVRTHLYVEAGFVKNNHGSDLGVTGYGTVVPGQNQTGVVAGIITFF